MSTQERQPLTPLSYADFGHEFIRQAVSAQRLSREIEATLQSSIEGTVQKMPADLIVASYSFKLNNADVTPHLDRLPIIAFFVKLCGTILLDVKVVNVQLKFSLGVEIKIQADVETYAPLTIKLVLSPISDSAIRIDVDPHNIPSDLLDRFRLIAPIVRSELVSQVNERIASAEIQSATTIDVLHLVQNTTLSVGTDGAPSTPAASGEPAFSE